MAVEAFYYRPDQDYGTVRIEPLNKGRTFSHVCEGNTPDGHYRQVHIVRIAGPDKIIGFSSIQYDGQRRHEQRRVLRGERINGSGFTFLQTEDPNVRVQLKYLPEV